jgi:hypothetical protein
LICPTEAFKLNEVMGVPREAQPEPAYRRRYYRVGTEIDLRPSFVQDVTGLVGKG